MRTKTLLIFLSLLTCLSFLLARDIISGASVSDPTSGNTTPANSEETAALYTLKGIIQTKETITEQLKSTEKELKAASTDDQKIRIASEIKKLNDRLLELENNFEQIAAGVAMETFAARPEERFNLKDQIQELIGPIIQELKNMTARPREIERLRNLVGFYEKRVPAAEEATGNVQRLIAVSKDEELKKELMEFKTSLENKKQQISNQLSVYRYQLADKLNERTSFWESIQNGLLVFFRSRGRNMILTGLAFALVFLLFRSLHLYLYKIYPILQSPKRSFYLRLLDVAYHALTLLGALLASLFVLYVSGDWVLMGLALLFLFGLAWTAKHTLPRFYDQAKLLLNLGSVRENERIVYNGLPWKVQSLNIYTNLVNPELKGGAIRIRLNEMLNLNSRPHEPDEPWFPCREGDWVILADGTRGKVVVQTPEIVQLVLLGGSRKTYPTTEFLRLSPNNISTNFRLKITFGLDYKHQAEITETIPNNLRDILLRELAKEGFGEDLIKLKVEFKEAGASSLDLEIIADFSGRVASSHERLSRAIQRIAVDASNENGWVIPFTQITVHAPDSP